MGNNNIRDIVISAFQVTKATNNKVPMLLLSNPGLAKTTIIKEIGDHYGYHVESLVGSGFENNEILGFQVNEPGIDHLITKNPNWYQTIINKKKENIPSILFIDEISVCPSLVQGALYRLIFERTIGNGNMLPDDCVIMSAGNYKENLPSYCDITSPALNRFCIINLTPTTWVDFLNEFSQNEEQRLAEWPKFKDIAAIDKSILQKSRAEVRTMMIELFDCYSNVADSSKGCLDISNKSISNMFDGEYSETGEVYNFISGRTYEYLQKGIAACVELNIPAKSEFVKKMTEGLIGAGTGSFTDANQVKSFLKSIKSRAAQAINNVKNGNKQDEETDKDIFDGETEIAQRVEKLSLFADGDDSNAADIKKGFEVLFKQITDKYSVTDVHNTLKKMLPANDGGIAHALLSQDMLAIEQLVRIVKNNMNNTEALAAATNLEAILEKYKFYADFVC